MGCLNSKSDSDQPTSRTYDERHGLTTGHTSQQNYGTRSSHDRTNGSESEHSGSSRSGNSSVGPMPISQRASSAKPLKQFMYLDRKYSVSTPQCGIPEIDEVFKSVCERYDIAVTNREKIDEALTLFKQVLELGLDTPLEECFSTWKEFLVNPSFIVNCNEATGDVKDIRVRADNIPKERRKAQKHIRDLLDACHLFLQQREFLQRNIMNDITQLDGFSKELQTLAENSYLNASQKKNIPKVFSTARKLIVTFPENMELFWRQVYSLVHDINTSVHVLDGVPGPESADLR